MSVITTILTEFQYIATWLGNAFFRLKLPKTLVPVPSGRLNLARPWFSASSADEFEKRRLAGNELYKSVSRVPVAR